MSVLESLAMRTPVIGARIGGIPELIEEGIDGMTFQSGNSDDLAEKMLAIHADASLRRRMGAKGREKIEQDYSPEQYYNRIMNIYTEITSV
jgi:glycosyltransferase involved in cell wall biosynthesis